MQEMQETLVWSLVHEEPLEWEVATHSSILAWKFSWTEEPVKLQSIHGVTKSQTGLSTHTHNIYKKKESEWEFCDFLDLLDLISEC